MKGKILIATLVIAALVTTTKLACYYHDQFTESQATLTKLNGELNAANNALADMQQRQNDVSAIDARYTQELNNARLEIDNLRRDVAAGNRRLQLNARCEPVRKGTAAAPVDDAASPRLTDAAQQDYYTLRERIETVTSQLAGIQDYVRSQCSKPARDEDMQWYIPQ